LTEKTALDKLFYIPFLLMDIGNKGNNNIA